MFAKINGYLFFYLGLVIIVGSAFSVYQVFLGNQPPIQLFHLPALTLDFTLLSQFGANNPLPNTNLEIIPASINNQFANLFAHLTLMGFLGGVGYRLSMIGAQILRPINIQVKETLKEISTFS